MTLTPGTTAPTAAPPRPPTAAPVAASARVSLLVVAQAPSDSELAAANAISVFFICLLPLVSGDPAVHASRRHAPTQRAQKNNHGQRGSNARLSQPVPATQQVVRFQRFLPPKG